MPYSIGRFTRRREKSCPFVERSAKCRNALDSADAHESFRVFEKVLLEAFLREFAKG